MEFTYNHEGIRTQKVKKVNGEVAETTDYILAGKKIIGMQKGTDRLLFHYDEGGSLIMLRHNGTPYTYVKNLQGDIIGLIDSTGAAVAEYKYDAWGNPISTRTLTSEYDHLLIRLSIANHINHMHVSCELFTDQFLYPWHKRHPSIAQILGFIPDYNNDMFECAILLDNEKYLIFGFREFALEEQSLSSPK